MIMTDLTKKIIKLLNDNGITNENIIDELNLTISEIESTMWEQIIINPILLYSLKDVIWYNYEHIPNGGIEYGLSNLKHLGTVCPNLINFGNESMFFDLKDIPHLLEELNDISSKWNSKWKIANLYAKSYENWKYGETNPSNVIIHNQNESPSNYGYNQTYGPIVGLNGEQIKKVSDNTILCQLSDNIGEYAQGTILFQLLTQIKYICNKSINNGKSIKINFEHYEY